MQDLERKFEKLEKLLNEKQLQKQQNAEIEKAMVELLKSDLPFVEKLSILTKAGLIDPVSLIIKACNEALQEKEKRNEEW